ncbi:hypothetical protein [Aureibacter tunicatorum]|uniref:Calx-beta domain-containing protein n=1 Tax=Aureibacter tunicatorum TaxID=866807 RepID=A0AAE3XU18_9BACT|nr:hypothetical protein [Aureibacter tunicatorum]MDR6241995.1 hypothetical protein [Aureibacter tunicatorum]BDD07272.1 hypothetical protein AUTU_47550 [Aureibacter tunicatorum]
MLRKTNYLYLFMLLSMIVLGACNDDPRKELNSGLDMDIKSAPSSGEVGKPVTWTLSVSHSDQVKTVEVLKNGTRIGTQSFSGGSFDFSYTPTVDDANSTIKLTLKAVLNKDNISGTRDFNVTIAPLPSYQTVNKEIELDVATHNSQVININNGNTKLFSFKVKLNFDPVYANNPLRSNTLSFSAVTSGSKADGKFRVYSSGHKPNFFGITSSESLYRQFIQSFEGSLRVNSFEYTYSNFASGQTTFALLPSNGHYGVLEVRNFSPSTGQLSVSVRAFTDNIADNIP